MNDRLPTQTYRIVSPELTDLAAAHVEAIRQARTRRIALAKELGAIGIGEAQIHGRCIGIDSFLFAPGETLPAYWRIVKTSSRAERASNPTDPAFQHAVPDARTPEGQQLRKHIQAEEPHLIDPPDTEIQNAVGWPHPQGVFWGGKYCYTMQFLYVSLPHPQYFLRVPVLPGSFYDEGHSQWSPPRGLQAIPDWELERAYHEHHHPTTPSA